MKSRRLESPASRIVFWQDSLSIHQAPLIREFAEISDAEVSVITERQGLGGRRDLGWETANYGLAAVREGMPETGLEKFVHGIGVGAINIVTGVGSYKLLTTVSRLLLDSGSTVFFQSEAWDPRGTKGRLRKSVYWYRRWMINNYSNAYLLAMGDKGTRAFASAGFSARKVIEFAYFTDRVHQSSERVDSRSGLLFVGSLSHRKGLDLLFDAMTLMSDRPMLSIVGSGPEKEKLINLATDFAGVHFLGPVPNSDVGQVMAEHELLILPSRHDGWGAVVNESLLVGTPVICSSGVGASAFLSGGGVYRGSVFCNGDSVDLKRAIEGALRTVRQDASLNGDLEHWSSRSISASVGANYLREIIDASSKAVEDKEWPTPPWRKCSCG